MAVRTRDELMAAIKNIIGDSSDDNSIGFMEDISDTLNDFDTRLHDSTDWKQKYEDNDKEWRNRYKERFLNPDDNQEEDDFQDDADEPKFKRFEDLFKEG